MARGFYRGPYFWHAELGTQSDAYQGLTLVRSHLAVAVLVHLLHGYIRLPLAAMLSNTVQSSHTTSTSQDGRLGSHDQNTILLQAW